MILTYTGDINHEILNQELRNLFPANDWLIGGHKGYVRFSSETEYPILLEPAIEAVEEVMYSPLIPAVPEILAQDAIEEVDYQPYVPAVEYQPEIEEDLEADPPVEYQAEVLAQDEIPEVAYQAFVAAVAYQAAQPEIPEVAYVAPVEGVPAVYGPDPRDVIELHLSKGLERRQSVVWLKIKAERDKRKNLGVTVNGKWFHSDDPSRIQQMALVMMGANIPPDLQWKTMDGSFILMTQALALNIFSATAMLDQKIFGVAESHRLAMMNSPNPESYDYMTQWPPFYPPEEN